MDNVLMEMLAAEDCIINILDSFMMLANRVLKHPELAEVYAKAAKKYWEPFLEDVKKSNVTHRRAIGLQEHGEDI